MIFDDPKWPHPQIKTMIMGQIKWWISNFIPNLNFSEYFESFGLFWNKVWNEPIEKCDI